MKEEKVNEEKGKKVAETTPVLMDPATRELIEKLQGEVTALKSKYESSLLAKLVEEVGGRTNTPSAAGDDGQFKFNRTYTESDIDKNDILEEKDWVTFVCHKVYHYICDDKRHGKSIQAPFDIISFKYDSTRQIKGGRETELIQMCTYTCKSVIERDWLREHSTFGVVFFDRMKGTEYSRDFEKSKALSTQMVALQNIGQQDLITMARKRGLNPGEGDLASLRASIAISVVDERFSKKENHTRSTLVEQHMEAEAMGKPGVAG